MITAYLTLLIIAPQDWVTPLIGLPVDYILYPIWFATLLVTGRGRHLLKFTQQDALLAMFVTWVFVSAYANASAGIDYWYLYMYANWLVLYKLVSASLSSMSHVRRAGVLLVLFAAVLAAESIQHMNSPTLTGWAGQELGWISAEALETGVPGRTRWVSIFDGPGVFCVVFTLALPFVLQYLGRPFAFGWRLLAMGLLGPLILAIYYTGSRGGFLATLAVLGMHYGVRTRVSMTKLIIVGVLLFSLFVAAPAYMTKMYDENRSAQHRVDMWIQGVEMVRYYPVFGIGRGHYEAYTGRLIAHNSALELAGETGLPGIFLWVALLFISFKTLRAFLRQSEDPVDRSYTIAPTRSRLRSAWPGTW